MSDTHPTETPTESHSAPHSHGAHDSHEHANAHGHDASDPAHIASHLKLYWLIGGVLLVFTCITVALSYVEMGQKMNWIVGMAVATFKVSLVGAIFMHLKGEVKTIWRPIWFTLIFCTCLFLLFSWAWSDPLGGHDHGEKGKPRTGTTHNKF